MFISRSTSKHKSGKVYHSVLLRESYREGKTVKKRTVANISHCSEEEINAIEFALKNKKTITQQSYNPNPFDLIQGRSIGGVYVLYSIAKQLGITDVLGSSFQAKLTLWLIFARIFEQGSRLSATRLHSHYDIASVIGLKRGFDENDLYDCLHWLCENQNSIEDTLFKKIDGHNFYWYDVTSSYFEGTKNELAAFGYNRDKKINKRIVVIGLLCQDDGNPVSIEAFKGNTQDVETFANQLIKLSTRFGCQSVILICDRGLIKDKQKELLKKYNFHYITALTMPQVRALLNEKIINIDDFTAELKNVNHNNLRFVYRRNPERAAEARNQRQERLDSVVKRVAKENSYLIQHPKANAFLARTRIASTLKTYYLSDWVKVRRTKRHLVLSIDEKQQQEKAKMDGCYIWTTDLSEQEISTREIYDRYKDLKYVEDDFRTFKTNFLEIRPIFVRSEKSTRGHLVVIMLAHMILRRLREKWMHLNKTVAEALNELSLICRNTMNFSNGQKVDIIPHPNKEMAELFEAIGISPPKMIEESKINVVTRRKIRSCV